MIEVTGDLFEYIKDNPVDAICCTTNMVVKANGELVMGAGIAKVFAKKYPTLAKDFGKTVLQMRAKGYVPNVFLAHEPTLKPTREYSPRIVYFATKDDWRKPSTLEIIEESLKQLTKLSRLNTWDKVVLPKPGCSNGGLDWKEQVRPLCEKYLDDRFIVISL